MKIHTQSISIPESFVSVQVNKGLDYIEALTIQMIRVDSLRKGFHQFIAIAGSRHRLAEPVTTTPSAYLAHIFSR